MEKKRSVGVTVIGILFILQALFSFGILLTRPSLAKDLPSLVYVISYSMVLAITGVGIFLLKRWALILSLALITAKTIQLIWMSILDIGTVSKSPEFAYNIPPVGVLIALIIIFIFVGGGVIYYLTRPKVKEQFKYK